MTIDLETPLQQRIQRLDISRLRAEFLAQGEFALIPEFLPARALDALLSALPRLDGLVHRNYIPKHKKGGSISRHNLDQAAPCFGDLYTSPSLTAFLRTLSGADLNFCPVDDPHTYALYYYTEPGDHIGYHYDTSYYRGARYTVLIGLVDAPSCQLEYRLHTKNPGRTVESHSVELKPGMLILFNGDKLYHRISPLAQNERRVSLTFEYLTDSRMHPFLRFVSNMKDSIAYFGFRQVFKRPSKHAPRSQ